MAKGGKRQGAGRPSIPKAQRRSAIIQSRVTEAEYKACQAAAKRKDLELRDWARGELLRSAGLAPGKP